MLRPSGPGKAQTKRSLLRDNLKVLVVGTLTLLFVSGLLQFYNGFLSAGEWPQNANLVQDKVLENCANKLVVTSYYGRTVQFDGSVTFTA